MNAEGIKKPRKPNSRGVRHAAQAYCRVCGWNGVHFYGKGSMGQAHAELKWHREQTGCK